MKEPRLSEWQCDAMSTNQQGRYEDRVAVITGAASGLGEAAARLLVAEGGRVIIADYGAERGEAVAASLGDAARFLRCDVTNENDVAAAMDLAVSTWGRLDGAFANAGIVGVIGPIEQTPMDDFDRTMAVLVRGVFVTVKHAGNDPGNAPGPSQTMVLLEQVTGYPVGRLRLW